MTKKFAHDDEIQVTEQLKLTPWHQQIYSQTPNRILNNIHKLLEFEEQNEDVDRNTLDYGFDFNEPKTMYEDGNRILIGRIGMPHIIYSTKELESASFLTIPRQLIVKEGTLYQRPLETLKKLRTNCETAEGYANKHRIKLQPYSGRRYELVVNVLEMEATGFTLELRASKNEATSIIYDGLNETVTLDRSDSSVVLTDTHRTVQLEEPLTKIQAFVDESSLELFLNDGKYVMTARIFPKETSTNIQVFTETGQVYFKFTKYDFK